MVARPDALGARPQVWQADAALALPESDPAPVGRQPPAWLKPPESWRDVAAQALRSLPFADLTAVGKDGYPVCVPVDGGRTRGRASCR